MAVKFFNMTRADFLSKKLLYKYMPLERALDLLKNQRLWFANPTIWKDPFEKRFIENKYVIGGVQKDFPWKDRVYAMCMTQTATSEAYWNAYVNNDIGISFKFNRLALLTELERISNTNGVRIYVGKVEYQKTSDIKRDLAKNPVNVLFPASGNQYKCLPLWQKTKVTKFLDKPSGKAERCQ